MRSQSRSENSSVVTSMLFQEVKLPELKRVQDFRHSKDVQERLPSYNHPVRKVASQQPTSRARDLAERQTSQPIHNIDHITSLIRTQPLQTKKQPKLRTHCLRISSSQQLSPMKTVPCEQDELKKQFGIATKLSMSYHPEANGAAE